jgi:hypothetical protein
MQTSHIDTLESGSEVGCTKDDLIHYILSLDERVVDLKILSRLTLICAKITSLNLPSYIIGLFTSIAVFLVSFIILLVRGEPIFPVSYHLLFVSLQAGLALVIMKSAYLYSRQVLFDILDCFSDEKAFADIVRWVRRVSNPTIQLVTCFFFALLACGLVDSWTGNKGRIPIFLSSYIVVFIAGFLIGNGAYFALTVPTVACVLSKCRFRLYCFAPSEAPFIRKVKSCFGMMTIGNAIVFSVVMLEIYLMGPSGSKTTMRLALLCLLFGVSVISYSFLYPHLFLSRIVRREKWAVLDTLQAKISSLYGGQDLPGPKIAGEIRELMDLYNLAKQSPDSSLNFAVLWTYFSSLILPMASFVAGLINWRDLLSKAGL